MLAIEKSQSPEELYEAIWQEYLRAGAIYGETHEGMMRWLKELIERALNEK